MSFIFKITKWLKQMINESLTSKCLLKDRQR